MKEVCLCIVKDSGEVHSIGLWDEDRGRYYSIEGGGWFVLNNRPHLFEYKEITYEFLRSAIDLNKKEEQ